MKILLNNNDLNEALNKVSNLGFVPTMGSLHKGHISLIRKSKKKASKTIVSIFINPKQFNNKKDFKRYPKNHKRDLSILKNLKVNYLYLPKPKQVYDSRRVKKIQIKKKDKILCAKYRKGHFEGVLDVMDRLTKRIKPKFIFMGIKDYQGKKEEEGFNQRPQDAPPGGASTEWCPVHNVVRRRQWLVHRRQRTAGARVFAVGL